MRAWLASLGRNKTLKFLSLFLAIALWLAVGGEERLETNLNLPLELVNLAPQLTVTGEMPSALQVRVVGPRSLIRPLTQSRLSFPVDLANYKAGRHTFHLSQSSFPFPKGVQVVRVTPNPLILTLSATTTRSLPVQVVFLGQLPEGYEIKEVKTRPAQVTVKGPTTELEKLKALPTLPLDISSLTSSTTLAVDLDFRNLHLTQVDPSPILADLDIAPKTGKRTLTGVPVTPQPQPARLSPARVTLALQGPLPLLKDLTPQQLKATVDTRGLTRKPRRLKVNLQLPPGLTVEKITPDTISARHAR
uniref:YbbR-like domain-containing protein n=1 Tax=Desulfobacca acetoxidans TaxID=60893 RepID=A0A7V4G8B4_9BACT